MKKAPKEYSFHSAFTMIELVFVIVIIGILAAVIIPNTRTNPLQEAATQLVSHIRYTQHLAMVDDRFDPNNIDSSGNIKWFKERWQLIFQPVKDSGGQIAYSIFSDSDELSDYDGKPTVLAEEIARHISDKSKYMTGGTHSLTNTSEKVDKKMNLTYSHGIGSYEFDGGCSGSSSTRISFDNMGRPIANTLTGYTTAYKSDSYNRLIDETCVIRLISGSEGSIEIHIEPETGYAHIVNI